MHHDRQTQSAALTPPGCAHAPPRRLGRGWRSPTVPKHIQIADFLRSVVKERLEGAVQAAYGEGIIDEDDVADAFDDDDDDDDDATTIEPFLERREL